MAGPGFAGNSSAPGRTWAKAEFHTSRSMPEHGGALKATFVHRIGPQGPAGWVAQGGMGTASSRHRRRGEEGAEP